eukprot:349682-Chlamydomonas_euryale.AAC.12
MRAGKSRGSHLRHVSCAVDLAVMVHLLHDVHLAMTARVAAALRNDKHNSMINGGKGRGGWKAASVPPSLHPPGGGEELGGRLPWNCALHTWARGECCCSVWKELPQKQA